MRQQIQHTLHRMRFALMTVLPAAPTDRRQSRRAGSRKNKATGIETPLLRAIGVLLSSILLMGSKLVVTVPHGGTVVSASGLFACSASERCTFITSDPLHGEVFTAISASGSHFSRWNNETGAVCPDEQRSSCSVAVSESSSSFTATTALRMNPVFEQAATNRLTESRFDVNSTHTAQFYEVDGATAEKIWQQLRGNANPLAIRPGSASKPLAESKFSYRYAYQPTYDSNGQTCSVDSGEVHLEFNTILPKLKAFEDRQARDQRQWLAFQAVIIKHEAGHQEIYRQLAREIPDALASVRRVPCAQLAESVQTAVLRAAESIKRASDNLDQKSTAGTHKSEKPLPSSTSLTISAAGSQLASPVIS